MRRFEEYSYDELVDLSDSLAEHCFSEWGDPVDGLRRRISKELFERQVIRDAWLDHCNRVAGEVIA